eukprot:jgi/Mesen1/3448/ME000194S02596
MRVTRRTRHSSLVKVCANLGPFGARDAKPEELESNFSDKAVGLSDTEHKILLPQSARHSAMETWWEQFPMSQRRASAATILFTPSVQMSTKRVPKVQISTEPVEAAPNVLGWKLAETPDGLRLRGEWKLRSFAAGLTLFERIAEVAEAVGHHPDLHLERSNRASVDIWSHSVGGVTEADFVLAAKIDQIFTGDLVDKKKFWA